MKKIYKDILKREGRKKKKKKKKKKAVRLYCRHQRSIKRIPLKTKRTIRQLCLISDMVSYSEN